MKFNKLNVVIFTCWILLLIALVLKLFGSDLFNIVIHNQTFIDICNWLDNNWFKYVITSIIYTISTYLVYLTMIGKKFKEDWWFIILLLPISYVKANFKYIGLVYELLLIILIPLIRCRFKNWWKVILGITIIIIFEQISLFVRNLNFYLESDSILISLILSIDYYIMIVLYYLNIRFIIKRKEMKK